MQQDRTALVLNFSTHHCWVSTSDTTAIHVFKFTDRNCDYRIFGADENLSASEWITDPLPMDYMRVIVEGEPPTPF